MTLREDLAEVPQSRAEEQNHWSVLATASKGFLLAAGLHLGVGALAGVTSQKLFKRTSPFLRGLWNRDVVRFASSVALSASIYKALKTLLQKYYTQPKTWHHLLTGFLAGLGSCIDEPVRRRTLTLYMVARALCCLVIILHKRGYLPSVPHFVPLVFGACEGLILVAVTRYPYLLPRSYYNAIVRWSMYYDEEKLEVYMRRHQSDFISCNTLLHQGSCHTYAWKDFVAGMWLYSKIYGGLYTISLFLLNPTSLLGSPVRAVTQLLKKTITSATFFAVNGTVVKYGICLLRNAWGGGPPIPHFIPALVGMVGSWSVLLERPSRRLELVYYVMPQVLHLAWRLICIKKILGLHKLPWGSVWLQCFSLAILMYAYESERDSISPLLYKPLDFLLGRYK